MSNIDKELFEKLMRVQRRMHRMPYEEGMPHHGPHGPMMPFKGPHGPMMPHRPMPLGGPMEEEHRIPEEMKTAHPFCGKHMPEGPMPEAGFPRRHHRPHRFGRERILTIVSEHEEGIRQRAIADILHINPSSLSEAIDKLEADRYIERHIDPSDRRATLIVLTEKGKARAWEAEDERNAAFEKLFKNLSEEEKVQLSALLSKMLEHEENLPDTAI